MSLDRETRWSRSYRSADGKFKQFDSRFLDGTATVTLAELQTEWPRWNDHERHDFCQAFACGAEVPDRENILRFLVRHSDHFIHSTIALRIVSSDNPVSVERIIICKSIHTPFVVLVVARS